MSESELGELERDWEQVKRAGMRGPFGLLLIFGGIASFVVGSGFGCLTGFSFLVNPPPSEIAVAVIFMALMGPVLGILAAAVLSVAGFALRRGARDVKHRLAVHEGGVALEIDDDRIELPWADVQYYRPPTQMNLFGVVGVKGPFSFFAVSNGKGKRIDVRGLPDLRDWGESIENRMFEAQLPAARAAIENGENVRFGGVFVTPKGISGFGLLNDTVAWDALKGMGIGKYNFLVIRENYVPVAQKGPLFIEVPNAKVLFALAHELKAKAALEA